MKKYLQETGYIIWISVALGIFFGITVVNWQWWVFVATTIILVELKRTK